MKRKSKRRRYGLPPAGHAERAKTELRRIKQLTKTLRAKLKVPDCYHAAHLVQMISEARGAYRADRHDAGRGRGEGTGSRELFDKFERKCLIHMRER